MSGSERRRRRGRTPTPQQNPQPTPRSAPRPTKRQTKQQTKRPTKARGLPLTGRGWGVLVAAVLAYVGGVFAGYPVFRILAGIAFGAVLTAIALTLRRPRVHVRRELYPARVERGKPALATLRIRNIGPRWQPGFAAYDLAAHARAGDVRERVWVRRLSPGAEATCRYELPTAHRGLVTVGPLVLELADPLGLARRRVSTGGRDLLRVQPKRHPVRTVVGGRPRHHHESRKTDNALRGSIDLRDVRPYVVGDEVRHVHWKATARFGQLMVRDYVDPDQPRIGLLLDTRPGVLSASEFEEAVEVVASVAFGAAMAGNRCRLLTPDGPDGAHGLDLVTAGPAAARMLLDTLTEIAQSGQHPRQARKNATLAADRPDRTATSDKSDASRPADGFERPEQAGRSETADQRAAGSRPLLPASIFSGAADGGSFVLVTGTSVSARELAPLADRHRSMTVVSIGSATDAASSDAADGTKGSGGTAGALAGAAGALGGAAGTGRPDVPSQRVRWIVATRATDAVRQWNLEG